MSNPNRLHYALDGKLLKFCFENPYDCCYSVNLDFQVDLKPLLKKQDSDPDFQLSSCATIGYAWVDGMNPFD